MLIYEGFRGSALTRSACRRRTSSTSRRCKGRFRASARIARSSTELSGAGVPEQITGVRVSASVFPILGVGAAHGRTFLDSEDQPTQDVAVLSCGLWQRRCGGDPSVVGRTMILDRRPYTIVGIMPASFQFPMRGPQINGEPAQVWTPLALSPFERSQQGRGMMCNHTVIGRLRGVAAEQATREAGALGPSLVRGYWPLSRARSTRSWSPPCRSSRRLPGRSSGHC